MSRLKKCHDFSEREHLTRISAIEGGISRESRGNFNEQFHSLLGREFFLPRRACVSFLSAKIKIVRISIAMHVLQRVRNVNIDIMSRLILHLRVNE